MVKQIPIYICIALAAALITFFAMRPSQLLQQEGGENPYPLVNPVVTSSLHKHFIINFQDLREKFKTIQAKYPEHTYVYFNYLNNSAWIGLNEREQFTAASLVKIPLAMAIYKAIEEGKLKGTETYSLEDVDLNSAFGDLYKMGAGGTLSLEQLMQIMLTRSDDTAANALYRVFERIGIQNPLNDVYAAMGWQFPDGGQSPSYALIHVKILSNMFLALYNSTYINPEHSQKILNYLTETPFDKQIVAGVPGGIPVAHKIGLFQTNQTLSDCGIIYAPNRSYVLCLASQGRSQQNESSFMKDISKAAYDYVMSH